MNIHIIGILTAQKSRIHGIIALFSACSHFANLGEAIFLHNFTLAIGNHIFSRHQNYILDQRAVLKTAQGIIQDRMPLYFQKLFLYFAVHSFALSCCQNNGCTSALLHYLSPSFRFGTAFRSQP